MLDTAMMYTKYDLYRVKSKELIKKSDKKRVNR